MYAGILDIISNREDWIRSIDVVDDDDNAVDLTTAAVSLSVRDQSDCERLAATVGDGITVSDNSFTISFDVSELRDLCGGTYKVGITITISDVTTQLFAGALVVVDGVVS